MSMPIEAVVAEREYYEGRIEELERTNAELSDLVMSLWYEVRGAKRNTGA